MINKQKIVFYTRVAYYVRFVFERTKKETAKICLYVLNMDRIDRNGTLGHEEVFEEIEIHLNALARSRAEIQSKIQSSPMHSIANNFIRHQ